MTQSPDGSTPDGKLEDSGAQAKSEKPQVGGVSPGESERRVAKTLLENPVADAAAVAAAEAGGVAAEGVAGGAGGADAPKRAVAKTLLENPTADAGADEAAEAAPRRLTKVPRRTLEGTGQRRVAKTLIENKVSALSEQDIIDASKAQDAGEEVQVRRQYVAKTMLDQSVLMDVSSRFQAKRDAKAAELAALKALEPVKPFEPIVADKVVSRCPWAWENAEPTERFRVCTKCQAQVYNFEGLEIEEAEAIIFKRENRKHAALYKRADGKFMTSDCPTAIKARRDRTMMIMVGSALVVAAVVLIMLLPPPPKHVDAPPPPDVTEEEAPKMHPVKNKDGSYHYEAGKGVTRRPKVDTTPVEPAPTPVADPDSDGNFWKYSNPSDAQPPGANLPDPLAAPSQPSRPNKPTPNSVDIPPPNPYVKNY